MNVAKRVSKYSKLTIKLQEGDNILTIRSRKVTFVVQDLVMHANHL